MITSHMQRLKKDLGIEQSLSRETQGVFFFPVDDSLEITIREMSPGVLFECEIESLPQKNRDQLYTKILLGNLFGRETFGAELGISQDEKKLIIQHYFDYDPDYKEFEERLEDFLNAAEFWKNEMKEAS